MDWAKAKTILIIALIITNGFLIAVYGNFGVGGDGFTDHSALSEFLAERNIYVDAEIIPQDHREMSILFVQNLEIDHDQINHVLRSIAFEPLPPGARADADYVEAANLAIQLLGLNEEAAVFKTIAENAVFCRIERDDDGRQTTVSYKNVIDGITLEKSHITLLFEDGLPVHIESEWLEAVNFHNRKQQTISAAQALLLFLAQIDDKKNIYIDRIEMIYWLDETIIDTQTAIASGTAFPTWKITYNGTEAVHILAYKH